MAKCLLASFLLIKMHLKWMMFCHTVNTNMPTLFIEFTRSFTLGHPVHRLQSFSFSTFRYTASAQNSQCESMGEKRACLSASRSTRLKRTRAKSTQNTSTLPPARSKSSRWGQWQEAVVHCRTNIHDHHPNDPPPPHNLLQPKGADRKQKTDREKMEKRAPQEKEKYQPSYETTILTEVSSSVMCSASG